MALISCPNCGKEISDKTSKCIHCGCEFEILKKKYCDECKKEISADLDICPNCGYSKQNKATKKENKKITKEEPPKKKSPIIWIVLIVIIVLILILVFSGSNNAAKNEKICNNFVTKLQSYIDKKDTKGFQELFIAPDQPE